mgnify:FL=1
MAHKTFSQEQFTIRFYSLQVSFVTSYDPMAAALNSLNKSLLLATFLRVNMPILETNLFFLKKLTFNIRSSDPLFFKL